jgi:hypothetical protein
MSRERRPGERPGATYRSAEWKARISAGLLRRAALTRAREQVTDLGILRLMRSGTGTLREMRPYLEGGAVESERLLAALGGAECVSPQRRVLLDDFVRTGVVLRAALARFVQTGDPECASRVGTLVSVRRASLVAIGLDEHRVEHDLGEYLSTKRATGAGAMTLDVDATDAAASDAPSVTSEAPVGGVEAASMSPDRGATANVAAAGDTPHEAGLADAGVVT